MSRKNSFIKRAKNLLNTLFIKADYIEPLSKNVYKSPYRSFNDLQQTIGLIDTNIRLEKIVPVSLIIESIPKRITKKRRRSNLEKFPSKTPKFIENIPVNKSTLSKSSNSSQNDEFQDNLKNHESLTNIDLQTSLTNVGLYRGSSLTDIDSALKRSSSDFEMPNSTREITNEIDAIDENSFKHMDLSEMFSKPAPDRSNKEQITDSSDFHYDVHNYSSQSLNSVPDSCSSLDTESYKRNGFITIQKSTDQALSSYASRTFEPSNSNDTYIIDCNSTAMIHI